MGLHSRFRFSEWFGERVMEDTKPPDDFLHPSTDLAGCEIAFCHRHDPDIVSVEKTQATMTRLLIGTLVHRWLQDTWESSEWEGYLPECEVDMTPGLPPGWSGTADLLLGHIGDGILQQPEFTLMDAKTVAGSGIGFIDLSVPKPEQHMQASAYYHAASAMGYAMAPELCILHIPVSAAQYKELMPPLEQWMRPLPRNEVFGEMRRRSQLLKRYLAGEKDLPQQMAKVSKERFNKKLNLTEHVEAPHWLVRFCDSPMCQCAGQTSDVISYDQSTEGVGSL